MSLAGKVCLVTGATRGIGRGIALQLGEYGATVYITGRTLQSTKTLRGSLQETAEEIEARGGVCVPVQCDHSKDEEIKRLFERLAREQDGKLDVLVNNAYAAFSALSENMGKKFWDMPLDMWDIVNGVGLRSHYLCTTLAAQLMVPRKSGLIVNVSSPGALRYTFTPVYGVGKEGVDRLAVDCGIELKKHNVACLSLWTGVVQTENMMDQVESQDTSNSTSIMSGRSRELFKNYARQGESVEYMGKCVVHLAKDPKVMQKTAKVHISMDLGNEYGFVDINGKKPPHLRQLNTLLLLTPGWTWLTKWIPDFVKFPRWMMCLAGNKF